MEARISIIVPVYNVEKYIDQCVKSLVKQTFTDWEMLLVDDGSTDNSGVLCDQYAKKDSRIKVLHKTNGGLSDARNAGMAVVSGEYVLFVDSDDYLKDETVLQDLIERAEKTQADVITFAYEKYYEDSKKTIVKIADKPSMPLDLKSRKEQIEYLTKDQLYISSACNKMIKREVIEKTRGFRKNALSEDIDWAARLLCCAGSFDYLNRVGYVYRQREGSISHIKKEVNCTELERSIMYCFKELKSADEDTKTGLAQYTAYQYATFLAVQAKAEHCPVECIKRLGRYRGILRYHGGHKKLCLLDWASRLLGIGKLCWLIRVSKRLWQR